MSTRGRDKDDGIGQPFQWNANGKHGLAIKVDPSRGCSNSSDPQKYLTGTHDLSLVGRAALISDPILVTVRPNMDNYWAPSNVNHRHCDGSILALNRRSDELASDVFQD